MRIILASRSPRRLALLKAAGLTVHVEPSHINESPIPNETVEDLVLRLAREKSLMFANAAFPIIAADTLVALHGQVLGQPDDLDEAFDMIRHLAGHTHEVHTGICVRYEDKIFSDRVTTRVTFRPISDEEITNYLEHNDVLDKAGAYAIQAGASSFITAIDGPLDNVIGLPMQRTLQLLSAARGDKSA